MGFLAGHLEGRGTEDWDGQELRANILNLTAWPWLDSVGGVERRNSGSAKAQDVWCLGWGDSSPWAVFFTIRIGLRSPGKTCWGKENLTPSSHGHFLSSLKRKQNWIEGGDMHREGKGGKKGGERGKTAFFGNWIFCFLIFV